MTQLSIEDSNQTSQAPKVCSLPKKFSDYSILFRKQINSFAQSRLIQRFVRFALCGGSGVFVNLAVLYILQEYFQKGVILSASIAVETAIINNFCWNELWTFHDIIDEKRGLCRILKRFSRFNMICFSGLIFNVLLMQNLHSFLGINVYIASLIAIGVVTLWNFWLNMKFCWKAV